MTYYDVRRTINLQQPVTGKEVYDALEHVVADNDLKNFSRSSGFRPEQHFVRDIDGTVTHTIGISNGYERFNVKIVHGRDLNNDEINLEGKYNYNEHCDTNNSIGVASVQGWPGRPTVSGGVPDTHECTVQFVEKVRDKLEKLLQKPESETERNAPLV